MAHLRCDFFSEALSLSTSMTVLLPQRTTTQIGMEELFSDPDPGRAQRAMQAMLTMTKLDVAEMRRAADSVPA